MLYALTSGVLIGLIAIFAKLAYHEGISVPQLLFLRFGIAIPLLIYLYQRKYSLMELVKVHKIERSILIDIFSGIKITSQGIIYVLSLTIFSTIIPYLMLFEAIKMIGSRRTELLTLIAPVTSLIASYFVLGEKLNHNQIVGCFLVMLGILLIQILFFREKQQVSSNS